MVIEIKMDENQFNIKKEKVYAVIVTYNPDEAILAKLVNSLEKCNINIIIVNNSEKNNEIYSNNFIEIKNTYNIGLSKALNCGIKHALANFADFIILFDQDSFISDDNLSKLVWNAKNIFKGSNVAAVGPTFLEQNTNKLHGFAHYKGIKVSSARLSNREKNIALYLITSGTVINPLLIESIGLMDEALFIDYIDIEWGLRANSLGYKIIGLNEVIMMHRVGDSQYNMCGYNVPIHSSMRLYYQSKNAIYLYRKENIPLRWKIIDGIYFMKRSILYLIIDIRNFKIILNGIKDGFKLNE